MHEDGASFGKGSTDGFFGFKLHALVHHSGLIVSAILTPPNFDEREAALALALSVEGGLVLGDLGYRSHKDWLGETLAEEAGMLLLHPADAGDKMIDDCGAGQPTPRAGQFGAGAGGNQFQWSVA